MNDLFKATVIVATIKKGKNKKLAQESNLYEKVNALLKGAAVGSSELTDKVITIIQDQSSSLVKELEAISKKLKVAEKEN
jgi:hypothetical protein